ncbi:MAG: hypothetical protein B5M53_07760 [Candidatus Cloacimonas sp. 4484_209]|nr:MAG: hypothetical protein B5M53_07760 [Candidatus Cloacimonas sp. 4484_209]
MNKKFILSLIVAVLVVFFSTILVNHKCAVAEGSDIHGYVWFQFQNQNPPSGWSLYIHTEKVKPNYQDYGWHYEPINSHYNTTAFGGNGTYRITAHLKDGNTLKAEGHGVKEYAGVPIQLNIIVLPIEGSTP